MMNQKTTHSEYAKLQDVFLKEVTAAFVDQASIQKQWKILNYLGEPDLDKAIIEYQHFANIFKKEGINIHYFPGHPNVGMDAMYCRDATIATDAGMILCDMGKAQRKGEPLAARETYEKLSIPILGQIEAPGTLEGGDVAWLAPKPLAVAHGYRTNQSGYEQLTALLNPIGVEVLQVDLPHYRGPSDVFHLMSILSPVDKDLAVVYSPLMPVRFRQELLNRGYDLVEVPAAAAAEFDSMGCNVLAIAPRTCLMVKGNPQTKAGLEKAGCKVYEYEGAEISVKGGGGPTCLTRPLWRTY